MQWIICILLCLATSVAQAAYLPDCGPPELRLKMPFAGKVVALKPLTIPEPEPDYSWVEVTTTNVVTVTNYVSALALTAPATNGTEIPVVTNLTNSSTNKVAVVMVEGKAEGNPLPPQVLMQFFRDKNSTNNNTAVLGNVGFTPPPPVPPPSSKATFEKR